MVTKQLTVQVKTKRYFFGFINHIQCGHVSTITVLWFRVYRSVGNLKSILGFTYVNTKK